MENVYYLKMNDPTQVKNYEFIDFVPSNFPNLEPGDLCFVRLEGEHTPSALKRIWEFLEFTDNADGSRTAKFEPHWKDENGKEIFFDVLQLKTQFTSLNWFEFSRTVANHIHKQLKNRSFFKLTIVKRKEFDTAIKSASNFNSYTSNVGNYRKVEVVDRFDPHSENIQLIKDATGVYSLNPASFIDQTTLIDLFDGNKPNEYAALNPNKYWMGTDKGKMYQFLLNKPVDYSLVGFYDLFCSQVSPTSAKTTKRAEENAVSASSGKIESETEAVEKPYDGSDLGDGYDYNAPMIETGGENLIIYGTPGCGKSHELAQRLEDKIPKDNRIRVTFHQDYTYTDFVGQILPVVSDDDKVKYEFVSGPFTLALSKAIEKPEEKVALVIEEINRGNAAAIFGDLFQLLDRNDAGTSVYPLTNVQIANHLKKEFIYTLDYIKLPSNLSIYATMNTGDQNVFTLDTAFKRRWNFEKLSNKFNKSDAHSDRYIPGMSDITWESFVTAINEHMIKAGTFDSEDKQLGKYFITYNQLVDQGEKDDAKARKFAYKVLEYLWNDVAKFDRENWFNIAKYKTLDDVLEAWITGDGAKIFNSDITFTSSTAVSAVSAKGTGEEK